MQGKWRQEGVPHKGWRCIGVEDLEEPSAICEMCEAQTIRYVHSMEHDDWPDVLLCGCVCAGHMEDDLVGARDREATMRRNASRRSRWLTRAWGSSLNGNPYLRDKTYFVVVYPAGPQWLFRVDNNSTARTIKARRPLPTPDAAKLRAFDAIEWMKQRNW